MKKSLCQVSNVKNSYFLPNLLTISSPIYKETPNFPMIPQEHSVSCNNDAHQWEPALYFTFFDELSKAEKYKSGMCSSMCHIVMVLQSDTPDYVVLRPKNGGTWIVFFQLHVFLSPDIGENYCVKNTMDQPICCVDFDKRAVVGRWHLN